MEKAIQPAMSGKASLLAPGTQRECLLAAALLLLYVTLDWLTYVFPARLGITPFHPEAAVGVAMLMYFGVRGVPLVFFAALWGEFSLPAMPRPWPLIIINGAVLTCAYLAVARLLAGRYLIRLELDTRRDVLRLIGVSFICMLAAGAIYVGVLVAFGIGATQHYVNAAKRFFIGYSVGILVAAPLLFMLFSARRRAQFMLLARSHYAWLQLAAILACVGWIFFQAREDHVRYFYLLFLPLIWVAARWGMVGAVSALVLLQASVLGVVHLTGYLTLSVFELEWLFIALAITGLLLGAVIDEQRRAVEVFRESLKLAAAGEMAAAITHEINQPLTALSAYASAGQLIAAMPNPDRAQLNDTMRKLMEESKRAAAVVRRLRDFFRSGATRLERISLAELAASVVESLRARAQAANVALSIMGDGGLPPVLVDGMQIEVVLRNLVMNAIDSAAHSAAGDAVGHVYVKIESGTDDEILVTVQDSGGGIREADVQRLFESFVTTKTTGMGMGLAISRAIVDAHGGRLWAMPGDSGVFCFTLPSDAPRRGGDNP